MGFIVAALVSCLVYTGVYGQWFTLMVLVFCSAHPGVINLHFSCSFCWLCGLRELNYISLMSCILTTLFILRFLSPPAFDVLLV